jgi:carbonic anhydrase
VVGFIIEAVAGSGNAIFETLLKGFEDAGCGGEKASNPSFSQFNPYSLLPAGTCFWNYDGSLTTPGCDEIVEWNLAEDRVAISHEQYGRLLQLVVGCPESISFKGSTSRPVQAKNGRVVNKICPASRRMLR